MLKLSSPWDIYYKKIEALFGPDPDIQIMLHEEDYEIKLIVNNPVKADAISKLLPAEKEFGNIKLKITVVPADEAESQINLIRSAFSGNPVLNYIQHIDAPLVGSSDYVMFRKRVVQFYIDDLADLNGLCSTLYQNIAEELIPADDGVHYCTDDRDDVIM